MEATYPQGAKKKDQNKILKMNFINFESIFALNLACTD